MRNHKIAPRLAQELGTTKELRISVEWPPGCATVSRVRCGEEATAQGTQKWVYVRLLSCGVFDVSRFKSQFVY